MGFKTSFRKFFDLDEDIDHMYDDQANEAAIRTRSFQKPYSDGEAVDPSRNQNAGVFQSSQAEAKVIRHEPRDFNDVQDMADQLKERRSIVFTLKHVGIGEAKRIIDFLSGAVYALDAQMQKLGPDTFICAPDHVDIDSMILEEDGC
ncbi:cell division protein SepF [Camelliibacillus cellulosilyticus]|uniref:Cell division protein SepF n=1 Tax=Camelliibacillus cellulosilyticus TaxID=2174486 RepID=A0ABV9GJD8_9BACL